MVEDRDQAHEQEKRDQHHDVDRDDENHSRQQPACQRRLRRIEGKGCEGRRLARAVMPGMRPAEKPRVVHEPVRPVVIGILHKKVDKETQEKIGHAAISAPIVIDGGPAMQQSNESERGWRRVDGRGEKREPYLLQNDGAHRAVPIQTLRLEFLAAALPQQPIKQARKKQITRRNDPRQRSRYAEKLKNHLPCPADPACWLQSTHNIGLGEVRALLKKGHSWLLPVNSPSSAG